MGMSLLRVGYSGSASDWLVFAWVSSSAGSTRESCMFSAIVSSFPGGGMEGSREGLSIVFSTSILCFSWTSLTSLTMLRIQESRM